MTVTPDVLRNAILGADRSITDFRLVQQGPEIIELLLPETAAPGTLASARDAVEHLLRGMGARADITTACVVLPPPTVKLRRVERRWRPAG